MEKKRILVTISFSFSIRYLYRSGLLHKMRDFAVPVVAITWNQEDLINELKSDGFEVHLIPESRWEKEYDALRSSIDKWFYANQSKTPSHKIQKKYLRQFLPLKRRLVKSLRDKYHTLILSLPGKAAKLFELEKHLLKEFTNYVEMAALVKQLNIDALFTVTPFHRQEDILLRACKDAGKKMITSILSFDNVTKRGWLPVEYDVYMLWNKYNQQELNRIYPLAIKKAKVIVTGAAQFDFYFNPDFLQDKNEWYKKTGFKDNGRQIILYAGGPRALLPQEPMFLKHIDAAISNGTIHGKPVILFRCHPMDKVERWKEAVGASDNIIYETSWTGGERLQNVNLTNDDIIKLCSNLAYTDVHINTASTMTVDGSVYNKPQIGPAYDKSSYRSKLLQKMYRQEHFIPIMKAGGVKQATSREALIDYINLALEQPENFNSNSKKVLEEIITYTDGRSTDRVAEILKTELEQL